MTELPSLRDVPMTDTVRSALKAIMTGGRRDSTEKRADALGEKKAHAEKMQAHFAVLHGHDTPQYRREVREWNALRRRGATLTKLSMFFLRQQEDERLELLMLAAAKSDTPLRKVIEATGLPKSRANHHLRLARADLGRERQGLPTRAQLRALERARQWARIKHAIATHKAERERAQAAAPQRRGRPPKSVRVS